MCVQEGEDRAIYGVRCWAITVTTFGVLSLLLVILSIVQGNLDWISGLSFLGAPAMIIGGATLTCCVAPITKMKTSISMGCAVIGIIVPLVQAAGGAARFAQIDALIGNAVATATANGNAASIQLAQIRTFITIFLIVGISIAVLLAGLNGPHHELLAARARCARPRCVTHAASLTLRHSRSSSLSRPVALLCRPPLSQSPISSSSSRRARTHLSSQARQASPAPPSSPAEVETAWRNGPAVKPSSAAGAEEDSVGACCVRTMYHTTAPSVKCDISDNAQWMRRCAVACVTVRCA